MIKSLFITIIVLMATMACYSQKLEVKKKLKVAINGAANPDFQVRFLDPSKDTTVKAEAVNFNPAGQLISFQLTKKSDWTKSKAFHKDSVTLPSPLDIEDILCADIKPDEGRLMVYFWPFMSKGKVASNNANKFLKDHEFAIILEDRINLSFHSSSWQFGALTLPLKFYLGAPDSVTAVTAAASVGLYVGRKWGRTKFVKLPSEKEFTTYQTAWSLNLTAGMNALEIKAENTSDKGAKFKGNVTTASIGIAGGWHYKTFTVFIAAGFDIPLSKKADNWSLKGKPWIGFGAGFEIF